MVASIFASSAAKAGASRDAIGTRRSDGTRDKKDEPDPALEPLPEIIPVFPLSGVLLLPRGSATLVAEAQREFAAKRFDRAEEKYLEVLRQDESNTYTLANLAVIQMERNRLEEANKHITQAMALNANDPQAIFLSLVEGHTVVSWLAIAGGLLIVLLATLVFFAVLGWLRIGE